MSDSRLPRCSETASACPEIHATISDVVTSHSEHSLDCSSAHLDDVKDTLEGERLRHVYSTFVENGIATSDSMGVANFQGFAIHGPEGTYHLNFAVDNALATFIVKMINRKFPKKPMKYIYILT